MAEGEYQKSEFHVRLRSFTFFEIINRIIGFLKGQYRHDQSRSLTGHGIVVRV